MRNKRKVYRTKVEEFGGVQKADFDALLVVYGLALVMLLAFAGLIYVFCSIWPVR